MSTRSRTIQVHPSVILIGAVLLIIGILLALTPKKGLTGALDCELIVDPSAPPHKGGGRFLLRNNGSLGVVVSPYIVLYWTNRSGMPTNCHLTVTDRFEGIELSPGESKGVTLDYPPDSEVLNTSFSYYRRYSWLGEMFDRISPSDRPAIVPDGPRVTNVLNALVQ